MKGRLFFIIGLILLVIAGLTFDRWFPPLMAFIGANSEAIQGLAALLQIIIWAGAIALAWFGLLRRSKSDQSTSPPVTTLVGDVYTTVEDTDIAIASGAIGNTVITGDYNQVVIPQPEVNEQSLLSAYLSHLIESAGWLTLSGIDRKTASEAEARLNLGAVYTALLTTTPLDDTPIESVGLSSETMEALKQANILTIGDVARIFKEAGIPVRPSTNISKNSLEELRRVMQAKGYLSLREENVHKPLLSYAIDLLNRHNRLVLLGDPGSGKSTFVNFVTLCLAGEALKRSPDLTALIAPLPPEEERSPSHQGEKSQPQSWDHGALLPVRVILRDFAARGLPAIGVKATAKHLWDFIVADLASCELRDYAPHLRRHLLQNGGMIMLDGLDEVPEAEQRRIQIKQAIEDFSASFPGCRFLVTSRTYAYQQQDWRLQNFVEASLAPFTPVQIRLFVERWYEYIAILRGINHEDALGRAERLKQAIFNNERIRELAERPLLLALMASLHAWRGGSLPEKREELYADTVDLLLDWWESPKVVRDARGEARIQQPSLAEWLMVDRQKVRSLLERLAYQAHAAQPDLTGTADIQESDLVAGLMEISQNPDIKPARLVEYLSNRAGLLVPRGVKVYAFPHRTFQEYLAACYLTGDTYPDEIATLFCQDPDRWREVTLLAASKAVSGGTFALWPLVDALCDSQPSRGSTVPQEWGSLLAGQIILENANLQQVSTTNQAKVNLIRTWQVHLLKSINLTAHERARAGNTLARLGDPRFDHRHWYLPAEPLLGFIEVPSGTFRMGSDPDLDQEAFEDEKPCDEVILPEFYMARYPVTVAQFRQFIDDSAYRFDRWARNTVPNHPVVSVSWYDAIEYCRWLTIKLCEYGTQRFSGVDPNSLEFPFWQGLAAGSLTVALPSEAEWEKAARGPDSRIYPWGDDFDSGRANTFETGILDTSSVGCFPAGASPYGCEDMSGNVWEWTRSLYVDYPYVSTDGREDLSAGIDSRRVLRGGSFYGNRGLARCAYRSRPVPRNRYLSVGFRVVVSPSVSVL